MKRFYKAVGVQEADAGWQVMLDGRGIKTVKGSAQLLPTEALAHALASEWDAQGEKIDPASLPMRDLADYAIDVVAPATQPIAETLVAYADTDTLLYRADPDEPLYARQLELWEPIVRELESEAGVAFERVSGIVHRPQPPETLDTMRTRLGGFDPFALAGLEAMVNLAASLITGLSAARPDADIEALWQAASLEEEWQAEHWGREEEGEARRAKRHADFKRAARFVALARS